MAGMLSVDDETQRSNASLDIPAMEMNEVYRVTRLDLLATRA